MPISITMPRLSDTMESGTIIKWNVKEGDKVSAGDVIADVETDKATMEMAAYDDGIVAKIAVKEGKPVSIGTVIAVLAAEGEDVKSAAASAGEGNGSGAKPPAAKASEKPEPRSERREKQTSTTATMADDDDAQPKPASAPSGGKSQTAAASSGGLRETHKAPSRGHGRTEDGEQEESEPSGKPSGTGEGRMLVSPVARRMAEEHRIDLRSIEGSGPGGRIIKRDVLKAMEAARETVAAVPPTAKRAESREIEPRGKPEISTRVPQQRGAASGALAPAGASGLEARSIQLSGMRQTIAKRLVQAKTTIPHYQVTMTFNMDALMELRSTLNQQLESQGVKLSVNDFMVKACALAMYEHPEFNSSWAPEGDRIEIHGEVNIGIAISVPPERGGGLLVATIRHADQKSLRMISYESKMFAEKARTRGLSVEEMSDSTFTISNMGMYGVDNFTAIINPPNVAILAVGSALKKPVVRNDELTVGHEMSATLSCDHRVIDGAMAAQYMNTLKKLNENPATLLV